MGFASHVKYHTIDHRQGLKLTKIQMIFKSYTLIKETLLISPQFCAPPILAKKLQPPNSQGNDANLHTQFIFTKIQEFF
jgi:hypothetical protein